MCPPGRTTNCTREPSPKAGKLVQQEARKFDGTKTPALTDKILGRGKASRRTPHIPSRFRMPEHDSFIARATQADMARAYSQDLRDRGIDAALAELLARHAGPVWHRRRDGDCLGVSGARDGRTCRAQARTDATLDPRATICGPINSVCFQVYVD